MSNRILPRPKPYLLFLHRAFPPLLPPRHIRVWPYALNDFVFLGAGKDFRDVGEEAVYFVGGVDDDAGVREREGDGCVALVGGAVY